MPSIVKSIIIIRVYIESNVKMILIFYNSHKLCSPRAPYIDIIMNNFLTQKITQLVHSIINFSSPLCVSTFFRWWSHVDITSKCATLTVEQKQYKVFFYFYYSNFYNNNNLIVCYLFYSDVKREERNDSRGWTTQQQSNNNTNNNNHNHMKMKRSARFSLEKNMMRFLNAKSYIKKKQLERRKIKVKVQKSQNIRLFIYFFSFEDLFFFCWKTLIRSAYVPNAMQYVLCFTSFSSHRRRENCVHWLVGSQKKRI